MGKRKHHRNMVGWGKGCHWFAYCRYGLAVLCLWCPSSLLWSSPSGHVASWQQAAPALEHYWQDEAIRTKFAPEFEQLLVLLQSLLAASDPVVQPVIQHEMDSLALDLLGAIHMHERQQVVDLPQQRGMVLMVDRLPQGPSQSRERWLAQLSYIWRTSPLALITLPDVSWDDVAHGQAEILGDVSDRQARWLSILQPPAAHLAMQRLWQVSRFQGAKRMLYAQHPLQDYSMYLHGRQWLALQWHHYHPDLPLPAPWLVLEPHGLMCMSQEQTTHFAGFWQQWLGTLVDEQQQHWRQFRQETQILCQQEDGMARFCQQQPQYQMLAYQLLHAVFLHTEHQGLAEHLLGLLPQLTAEQAWPVYQQLDMLLQRMYYIPRLAEELDQLVNQMRMEEPQARMLAVVPHLAMASQIQRHHQHTSWLSGLFRSVQASMYPGMTEALVQATLDP